MSKPTYIVPTPPPRKERHTPFEETDYKSFVDTGEVLRREHLLKKISNLAGSDSSEPNTTFVHLDKDGGRGFSSLAKNLQEAGLRLVSETVKAGSYALVLESNNHQMIRIASNDCDEKPTGRPDILQPLKTLRIDGCKVDILPKVHSFQEIMRDDALAASYGLPPRPDRELGQLVTNLIIENWNDGRFLWDCSPANIGLIQDGQGRNVPIIIDPGAVINRNDATEVHYDIFQPRFFYVWKNREAVYSYLGEVPEEELGYSESAQIKQYINYLAEQPHDVSPPYRAAQEAHVERLGLEYGKITGVLDDAELMAELVRCAKITDEHNKFRADYNASAKGAAEPMAELPLYTDQSPSLYTAALNAHISRGQLGAAAQAFIPNVEGASNPRGLCEHIREQLEKDGALPKR